MAWNEIRNCRIRSKMVNLLASQNWILQTQRTSSSIPFFEMKIGTHNSGFSLQSSSQSLLVFEGQMSLLTINNKFYLHSITIFIVPWVISIISQVKLENKNIRVLRERKIEIQIRIIGSVWLWPKEIEIGKLEKWLWPWIIYL